MRKYYCDSCGVEVRSLNVYEAPCHLYQFKGKLGYTDSEGNHISGKMNQVELCNKCWNVAHTAALKAIGLPR